MFKTFKSTILRRQELLDRINRAMWRIIATRIIATSDKLVAIIRIMLRINAKRIIATKSDARKKR